MSYKKLHEYVNDPSLVIFVPRDVLQEAIEERERFLSWLRDVEHKQYCQTFDPLRDRPACTCGLAELIDDQK